MVTQNKKIINVGISPKLSQPCWVALSLSFSLLLLGSVLKSQILLLFSGFSDLFIFCFFMLCFFFVYFILFGAVILQLGFEDNVPFLQCRGFSLIGLIFLFKPSLLQRWEFLQSELSFLIIPNRFFHLDHFQCFSLFACFSFDFILPQFARFLSSLDFSAYSGEIL